MNNINNLKPKFFIGKNKITKNLIDEIKIYLDKNKIVKIKILQFENKEDIKKIIGEISIKTNSKIIKIIGFNFIIEKIL